MPHLHGELAQTRLMGAGHRGAGGQEARHGQLGISGAAAWSPRAPCWCSPVAPWHQPATCAAMGERFRRDRQPGRNRLDSFVLRLWFTSKPPTTATPTFGNPAETDVE
jgi:hypothetical protein